MNCHGMPIEVSVELFDKLEADMKEAKNKKTNCLGVVESVEECLCLFLQGSLKQINAIGCVETNNPHFSLGIHEPVIFFRYDLIRTYSKLISNK
ncbi:unnamed protein product [Caenorhabditis brenneri]